MIAKITKGSDVGGLLRYLFGPGEHNEHRDQHVVTGYTSDPAMMEPPRRDGDRVDVRPLTADLMVPIDLARAFGRRIPEKFVWHCSLSLRDDEGQLPDERWRAIAEEFVKSMGFAGDAAADVAGCHWVAVRHGLSQAGNDHIHLVVTLATEEGGRVSVHRDYPRAQQAVRRLEERFGLASTAVRDGETHRPSLTRADYGRAARHGDPVPDRTWLRHQVRVAAAAARSEAEWVADLRARGVLIGPRVDAADPTKVTGYAVARDHPARDPVYYAGSKLDGQLSLPRLRRRWPGTAELPAGDWPVGPGKHGAGLNAKRDSQTVPRSGNAATWRAAAACLDQVTSKAARLAGAGDSAESPDAQLIADRAVGVMTRLADVAEPGAYAALARASDDLARAATPARHAPRRTATAPAQALARDLSAVGRLIAATTRPRGRGQLTELVTLIAATARLAAAIAQLHAATQRRGAAGAALTARAQLAPILNTAAAKGIRPAPTAAPHAGERPVSRISREQRAEPGDRSR